MATVEIDDDTAAKLRQLRATIRERTGEETTEREIVARLVEAAVESNETFAASFAGGAVPLSEAEISRQNQRTFASGAETDEADIDEVLYGEERNP